MYAVGNYKRSGDRASW